MLEELIKKANFKDALWVIIASFAIVNFWRGTWGILDTYLFPENYKTSLFASLIIGLSILFLIAFYRGDKK
jgi:hypothetical protein